MRCKVIFVAGAAGQGAKAGLQPYVWALATLFPLQKPDFKNTSTSRRNPPIFQRHIVVNKNTIPDFLFLSRLFSNNENALVLQPWDYKAVNFFLYHERAPEPARAHARDFRITEARKINETSEFIPRNRILAISFIAHILRAHL